MMGKHSHTSPYARSNLPGGIIQCNAYTLSECPGAFCEPQWSKNLPISISLSWFSNNYSLQLANGQSSLLNWLRYILYTSG